MKCIDPALCLYIGAYLICIIKNDFLKEKVPRGNGTLCRLVSIKMKDDAPPRQWKNYHGKKVWTVCAKDCKWMEVEHVIKTSSILVLKKMEETASKLSSCCDNKKEKNAKQLFDIQKELINETNTRRFKLEPQNFTTSVSCKPHHLAKNRLKFTCRITQFPVNTSKATTGHKLQGSSKDVIIISSWPKGALFKNWEYTVLSRVRTLDGLYLFEPLSEGKSFEPSDELSGFFRRAKRKHQIFLEKHKQNKINLTK